MPYFNIVASTSENTVVTEYVPVKSCSDTYQSEAELEKEFIQMLGEQGYEYLPVHSEAELILGWTCSVSMFATIPVFYYI